MVLSESVIEWLNETGEILIVGLIVLIIMFICFAYHKYQQYKNKKDKDSESAVVEKFRWDFFYSLLKEGIVEILISLAELIIFFLGEESSGQNSGYKIFLIVIRVSIVLLILHQSTIFLYSKPLLDDDEMKKRHSVLFQDYKISKNNDKFKNYPTFFNLCTLSLRIIIVMMILLEPLKPVYNIEIQVEIFLFYTCLLLHYQPYSYKVFMNLTVFNHIYMMLTYLLLQQQHRDHFYNSSYEVNEEVLIWSFYILLVANGVIVSIMTARDCFYKRNMKKEME